VRVDADALFIEDNNVWTSAGTAAGIDLCIHLVRMAHGAEAAAVIARSMVTAPFRSGTQAQFIEHPTPATDRDADALAAVRQWAVEHLDEALTVAGLARRAGMSARSFARHFVATTGETPLKWLLAQRLARAQKLLERTDLPMAVHQPPRLPRRVHHEGGLMAPERWCSVHRVANEPVTARRQPSRRRKTATTLQHDSPAGDDFGLPKSNRKGSILSRRGKPLK
jgi:AraC-like DNA-binding protein